MKHLSTSGCGWAVSGNTYTCAGLPKLDAVFATTQVTGSTIEGSTITYDHFNWLPQHIEGLRMTLSPIIDMSATSAGDILEVPELACRVDVNPFDEDVIGTENSGSGLPVNPLLADTGFIDLYNTVKSYNTQFYVTVDGTTAYMTSNDVFPQYSSDAEMGPGMLEPMLNTQFGPVGVDMPPTADLTTDAIIYSLAGLQSWRHTIDTRVSQTFINTSETGMVNLENAKNQEGGCANFSITSLNTVVIGTEFQRKPTYAIMGNTFQNSMSYSHILVNGQPVTVSELSNLLPPFDAYLDVYEYSTEAEGSTVYGATITVAKDDYGNPVSDRPAISDVPYWTHLEFEYIGSVAEITGSTVPLDGSTVWTLYEIKQGDCLYEINIGGGTGGGGGTCSCEYKGPFKVIAGSTIGSVEITGPDRELVGSSYVTRAGYVCKNGADCRLAPTGEALMSTLSNGDYDVYANYTTSGISYSFAPDTTSVPKAYSVRLAKVTDFTTIYDVIITGQTTTPASDVEHSSGAFVDNIIFANPTGSIISGTMNTTGTEYKIETGTTGIIYGVADGTFTGLYQEGGTASVTAKDVCTIEQYHHGDIYVDGRWQ